MVCPTGDGVVHEINPTAKNTIHNKILVLLISYPPINRNSPLKRPLFYSSPGDNLSFFSNVGNLTG